MIVAVKNHLRAKLTEAGLPDNRISSDPAVGEWPPPAVPYAEILAAPERLTRRGKAASREYNAGTGQATKTVRLFERVLPVTVAIVHGDEARLDALATAFLAVLARGFEENGQFIRVGPTQAAWNAWRGERPRNRHRVEIRIECMGGVYASGTGETLQALNAPTVNVN